MLDRIRRALGRSTSENPRAGIRRPNRTPLRGVPTHTDATAANTAVLAATTAASAASTAATSAACSVSTPCV